MKKKSKKTLAQTNRALAREWHPTKNGPLTPDDVTAGSGKKVWWKCGKGHEWEAQIYNRSHGAGCHYCAGRAVNKDNCLRTRNPKLAREWDLTRNAPLTPQDVTVSSSRKVWWICKQGHEWKAVIANRNDGAGCPYCSGRYATAERCLQILNPRLAKEWHTTRNAPLTPKDVTARSPKKAWWICRKGHEWESSVSNRGKGNGCPYCSGRKAAKEKSIQSVSPWLAKEWHPTKNRDWTPKDVTPYSSRQIWWKCKKGHEHSEQVIDSR